MNAKRLIMSFFTLGFVFAAVADLQAMKRPRDGEMPACSELRGVGLKNFGNSCYFNASLQALINLTSFAQEVSHAKLPKGFNFEEKQRIYGPAGVKAGSPRRSHHQEAAKAQAVNDLKKVNRFCSNLKGFLHAMRYHPEKRDGKLRAFYEQSCEDIFELQGRQKYEQEDAAELLLPLLHSISRMGVDRFDFSMATRYACDVCTHTRTLYGAVARMLELPIPSQKNYYTFSELLDAYCCAEHIDDPMECEACTMNHTPGREFKGEMMRQLGTRQLLFETMPQTLFIQLKRFNMDWERGRVRKTMTPIGFPRIFNFAPYMANAPVGADSCWYFIKAIIYHSGNGLASGHYTASAMNAADGRWDYFDDSEVNLFADVVAGYAARGGTDLVTNPAIMAPNGGLPYIVVYEKMRLR